MNHTTAKKITPAMPHQRACSWTLNPMCHLVRMLSLGHVKAAQVLQAAKRVCANKPWRASQHRPFQCQRQPPQVKEMGHVHCAQGNDRGAG